MDANLALAIANLPAECQLMVIGQTVKRARNIELSDFDTELDELVEPLRPYECFVSMAKVEAQRVNSFILRGDGSHVVWRNGKPKIRNAATGQMLFSCPEIRHLEVVLQNFLHGADFTTPTPVMLPASTTSLLQVLPIIFPRLDTIKFKIINLNHLSPWGPRPYYTTIHGTRPALHCRTLLAVERASRMYQLIRLVHETDFPLWKFQHPVKKSLVFVQSVEFGRTGKGPCKKVRSGPPSFWNPANMGLSNANFKRMWGMCEWPGVRIDFTSAVKKA